jgi:hypothetical protein
MTQKQPATGKNGCRKTAEVAGRLGAAIGGRGPVVLRAQRALFAELLPAALFKSTARAALRRVASTAVPCGMSLALPVRRQTAQGG